MEHTLTGANIVVLAKNHNPSIVSKEWLIQNRIIEEKIIDFAHFPVISVIESDNFKLLVDQDRLQLSIKKISQENLKELAKIISKYINQLPETPYTAIGFNYLYTLKIGQKKLKNTFFTDDKRLIKIFSENYAFGGIIKFMFGDFMAKLTIRPKNNGEVIADFNFHFPSNKRNEIIEKLFEYPETKGRAEEILEGLFYD